MKQPAVLIVDDDNRNVFALTSYLEATGMLVFTASNGLEAIEMLKNTKVDVVLMDIMMPEMDGYEAIKIIREIPEIQSIPIIAVTAKAMKGDREKCLQAGATDYISKPIELPKLVAEIEAYTGNTPL